MNFVIHVFYVTRYTSQKKSSYVSPINDDLEASAGYAFDESGRVQMTPSLQHATVHLNGMKNEAFFLFPSFVSTREARWSLLQKYVTCEIWVDM